MPHQSPFTDRAITFAYKAQRKVRRQIRRRFTAALVRRDAVVMHRQLGGAAAKDLIGGYPGPALQQGANEIGAVFSDAERALMLAKAQEALNHQFDILGSGLVDGGNPIHWHQDLKTGHCWPRDVHHLDIAWDAVPEGADIKMPWDLNRCHHLVTLALADHIEPQIRYYAEFKSQIQDWIRSNPCGYGVNWVCAMDVAIRAVNWLAAASLFRQRIDAEADNGFETQFIESLWHHGCHIMRNLEWQGPKSPTLANHFLANLCGLLAIGTLFRDTRQGRKWLAFARKWLENEIRRQVLDDGVNFETSTNYHRLTFEMFQWSASIADALAKPFSQHYQDKLAAMSRFCAAYMSPSGRAAQIGDNDSGRLLDPGIGDLADHRYLAGGPCGAGGRASRLLLGMPSESKPSVHDGKFPSGGFFFGKLGEAWLGVRAGRLFHTAGHGHADQLQFVFALEGHDILVDPGTGVYSADVKKRNHYRGASAHNAPRVNGWEPNEFPTGKQGIFRFSDNTKAETLAWQATGDSIHFEGRHAGYVRLREDCVVRRKIHLSPGILQVRDTIENTQDEDRLDWSFQFAPGVALREDGDDVVASIEGRCIRIRFEPQASLRVESGVFSPAYGVEQPAMTLHATRRAGAGKHAAQLIEFSWESFPRKTS